MVKILKIAGYVAFFVLALIYFIPKISVYYFLEKELEKQEVILSKETLVENIFTLELHHPELSFKAIESAKAKKIDLNFLLLYNVISIEEIELSDIASSFAPLKVEYAQARHTILNPLVAFVKAKGEFGELDAEIAILDRNISMTLKPSPLMLRSYKRTLNMLKKNENGEYTYAKTF